MFSVKQLNMFIDPLAEEKLDDKLNYCVYKLFTAVTQSKFSLVLNLKFLYFSW